MKRKAISLTQGNRGELLATCNDGTMWRLTADKQWLQLPDIPHEVDTPGIAPKNLPCQQCGALIVFYNSATKVSMCINGHKFVTSFADLPTTPKRSPIIT